MISIAPFSKDAKYEIDFGDQVVGSYSRAHRVVITNTGGAPLVINSVSIEGENPAEFSFVKDTCSDAEVVPYRACVLDLTFLPSSKDDFNAQVKLITNVPGSPLSIGLTGEGINSINVPPSVRLW